MNSSNVHLFPGQSILGLPILITHYEVIHFENCSKLILICILNLFTNPLIVKAYESCNQQELFIYYPNILSTYAPKVCKLIIKYFLIRQKKQVCLRNSRAQLCEIHFSAQPQRWPKKVFLFCFFTPPSDRFSEFHQHRTRWKSAKIQPIAICQLRHHLHHHNLLGCMHNEVAGNTREFPL